jgi:pyruvate carboxylase
MCEAAGIVFIGPSSKPMNEMGDKINSKKIVKAAGIDFSFLSYFLLTHLSSLYRLLYDSRF